MAIFHYFGWFGFELDIEVRRTKIKAGSAPAAPPFATPPQRSKHRNGSSAINSNFTLTLFDGCVHVALREPLAERPSFIFSKRFGTMERMDKQERLAQDIRRQVGNHTTVRMTRAMPAFRVVEDLPYALRELLDRLDQSENPIAERR